MAETDQTHSLYTRRQFLKTSGMAAAMTSGFLTFLHNAFGQDIDNLLFNESMFITGIYPDPAHIGKQGIHLRWLFPLNMGFPDHFILHKRIHIPSKENFFLVVKDLKDSSYFDIQENGETFQISFKEELEFLGLDLGVYGTIVAKAYLNKSLKFVSPATMKDGGAGYIEFQGTAINKVELPKGLKSHINQVTFVLKGNGCKTNEWNKPAKTIIPIESIELLNNPSNFFRNHYNVYLPKEPEGLRIQASKRYYTNLDNYENLYKAYHHTNAGSFAQNETPEQQYYRWRSYQNALLMCLPDPNIARILGLYYVDEDVKSEKGEFYDYKIEAVYKNKTTTVCAIVYRLGGRYDALPDLNPTVNFNAVQNAGGDFVFAKKSLLQYEQHGSVKLEWNKPFFTLKTNPVYYFLEKNPTSLIQIRNREPKVKNEWTINGKKGAIITPAISENDNNRLFAFDPYILIQKEKYNQRYQLSGIDLFGRIGSPVQTQADIRDRSLPVPPVALKIVEKEIDKALKHFLQFSYGPEQYLKSPDAGHFSLYKKEYKLSEPLEINCIFEYKHTSQNANGENNDNIFLVTSNIEIKNANGSAITSDIATAARLPYITLQLTKTIDGGRLPARERMHFSILKIFAGGKRFLISTSRDDIKQVDGSPHIDPCIGQLKSNSRLKENWIRTNHSESYTPPQEWKLRPETSAEISTTLLFTKILSATIRNIPLFDEPGTSQQKRTVTELKIDRKIFRSGLLNNHFISADSNIIIIAQSSPDLLMVAGDHTNLAGTAVKIKYNTGNTDLADTGVLRKIQLTGLGNTYTQPGKLLLKTETTLLDENGDAEVDASGITQLMERWATLSLLSDVYQTTQHVFETLVILPKEIDKILTTNHFAYFFPDYELDISSVIETPVPADSSIAPGYFALTTTDNSSPNNEGGLSAHVQHLSTITAKPPQVSPVFLCERSATDTEPAYVSLPNKDGRSTVCLQWDEVKEANGPYSYELCRALDLTILSVARSKWMVEDGTFMSITEIVGDERNNIPRILPSETHDKEIGLNNLSLNDQTGLYEGGIETTAFSDKERQSYLGSRIRMNSNGKPEKNYYFMVTAIADGKISLRLLNPADDMSQVSFSPLKVTLYKLEAWDDSIINNIDVLKKLANACPEAFSLVTKVPVRETTFLDDLPGQGNGKFFYKVRAVDRAGNKSESWSDCSVPFYQVDTRVPDPPIITKIDESGRAKYFKWKNDNNVRIIGYNITKEISNIEISHDHHKKIVTQFLVKGNSQPSQNSLSFSKIRYWNDKIKIPPITGLQKSYQVSGVFRYDKIGNPDFSINYLIKNLTSINGQIINHFHPSIKEAVKVVIVLETNSESEIVIYSGHDGNLETSNGKIYLSLPISKQYQLKAIYKLNEYMFGKSVDMQTAENYFISKLTYISIDKLIISGVYSGLDKGEPIVLHLSKQGQTDILLHEDNSEFEYIEELNKDIIQRYQIQAIKMDPINKNIITASKIICIP